MYRSPFPSKKSRRSSFSDFLRGGGGFTQAKNKQQFPYIYVLTNLLYRLLSTAKTQWKKSGCLAIPKSDKSHVRFILRCKSRSLAALGGIIYSYCNVKVFLSLGLLPNGYLVGSGWKSYVNNPRSSPLSTSRTLAMTWMKNDSESLLKSLEMF